MNAGRLEDRHASLSRTLAALSGHSQGHHGWSPLHGAIFRLHSAGHPSLYRALDACWLGRPMISDSHLVTLLGIAVRKFGTEHALGDDLSVKDVLDEREHEVADAIAACSNSFTSARRFIVAQPLIAAFAASRRLTEVHHLDLGTGLGLLPRQLNHRAIFSRYAADLRWHPAAPAYRDIPLTARYGVDAHPLPTLAWVRDCYGPSDYYDDRLSELIACMDETSDGAGDVLLEELDLRDTGALRDYMVRRDINTATCNMVLYQYEPAVRQQIVATVVDSLAEPGLLITMEPSSQLTAPGCRVDAYLAGSREALHIADISDAHVIGDAWSRPGMSQITGVVPDPSEAE